MKTCFRFTLALATTLCGYAWSQPAPNGCGPNKAFVCSSNKDVGVSYCARNSNHDGLAVRIVNPETWALGTGVNGLHNVSLKNFSAASPYCVLPAGKQAPMAAKDKFVIKDDGAGNLTMDILQAATNFQSYFGGPITIPKPKEPSYYLKFNTGSAGPKPYSDLDIFVMLTDDQEGHPKDVDRYPIEKYYHVEVFPSVTSGTPNCSAERPDVVFPVVIPGPTPTMSFLPANFTRAATKQDLATCVRNVRFTFMEVVTGGGGEHPPN